MHHSADKYIGGGSWSLEYSRGDKGRFICLIETLSAVVSIVVTSGISTYWRFGVCYPPDHERVRKIPGLTLIPRKTDTVS